MTENAFLIALGVVDVVAVGLVVYYGYQTFRGER